MLPDPQTTKITITGEDGREWRWRIVWHKGSEETGSIDTFEEARLTVAEILKRGEQPL